ncbi:hypothetical protein O181_098439, partial [Austropuccinia psidii MF-1]|nr:hypothetical protein [Austropuccinia psidii MF-1]
MSPVYLRNQPEKSEGLSRTRRPGGGQFETKPQTRGLEEYESISSALLTPQESFPMEHGQQEAQPSIPLGRTLIKLSEDMSQIDTLQIPHGNNQSLKTPPG